MPETRGRKPGKTRGEVMSVRLERQLDRWAREVATVHSGGLTGLLNEAVRCYRTQYEKRGEALFAAIVDGNGQQL